jgi:cytochrome c oxidase assembly factor CtaG
VALVAIVLAVVRGVGWTSKQVDLRDRRISWQSDKIFLFPPFP